MSDTSHIQDLPGEMHCAWCEFVVRSFSSLTGDKPFAKGTIVVCSRCSKINVMSDTDLRKMSRSEFENLDGGAKMNIFAAVNAVQGATGKTDKN